MFRQRAFSSVAVVIVGVVPALFGVWGVAVAFACLGLIGLTELHAMFGRLDHAVIWPICVAVVLLTVIAVAVSWPAWVFSALAAATLVAPVAVLIFRPSLDGTLAAWMATIFATLAIALPLGHAVAVRQIAGVTVGAGAWLTHLEDRFGLRGTTVGLAWFLLALTTTWLTDTCAYLSGRAFGKHLMAPVISPKKTWEGFAGGITGAILTTLITNWAFGVGMREIVAALVGIVIALAATVGDLAESLLKRQTGVKDSGALIPGHGGILDRIDGLLFAFIVVYYIARAVG
ncbi:MAG: phosphatidate cytidylyltransferase [Thermomicrobia bacterium]|nr:phosphatidate cytidylyltransferase [Thermomicrobia bacterium]MCA1725201.1 phosphatidate cytidylyltransferase [Thermomicrobia bacterium]